MALSICQELQNFHDPCIPMPTLAGTTHKPCDTYSSPEVIKKTLHVHEKTDKLSCNDDKAREHNKGENEGWSFIQALSNTIQNNDKNCNENEEVYVHPLAKRSSSALSKKSLEMCTESLGSETGSDGSQSSDEMYLISPANRPKETSKYRIAKTYNSDSSFPPPLRTVGSSRGVQVKSHREGGRLILEAVMVTPSISCIHAERSDGRLRLRLLDNFCINSIDKGKQVEEEEAEGDYDHDDIDFEQECEADDGDYHGSVVTIDGEIEGTSEIADGESTIGKLPRPSRCRCKEGGHENKGLQNWESFWVAT